MRVSIADEGDNLHQPDNAFILVKARNGGVKTRDFVSETFPRNGVKSINVPARKFGGKIAKVCAPGIRRDVCGRLLRRARGRKNGERERAG